MWEGVVSRTTEATGVGKAALLQLGVVLAKFIILLVIIFIGCIFAKTIKTLIVNALKAVKIDKLAESTGINTFLAKGGIKQTLSEMIGVLAYWLGILVTATIVVNFLGLVVVSDLLKNMIEYIPSVIVGIFILVLGIFLANFLKSMVEMAAANAGLVRAKLLAKIVEVTVIIFAIVIALDQLKIASDIITLVVKAIIVSIAAAIAIAFGLGCKDMAAKSLATWLDKLQEKR